MADPLKKATSIALAANIFLFIIKLIVGIISNSIAMLSEAVNSLTDIVSSLAIKYSVKISATKADAQHQFGHRAAQPLATFIVAVLAGVLGFNIIKESVTRLINPPQINVDIFVYLVLGITIFSKILMNRYQIYVGRKHSSPAIRAQAVDSINDVIASSVALIGIILVKAGYPRLDAVAGIGVSYFILRSGYEIAKENIDYLMGKSADESLILDIANKALKIDGVKGLNDIRSHYVGDKFHVEIHIEVDKLTPTKESHDIGKQVQYALESMPEIQKAFIHIDPI